MWWDLLHQVLSVKIRCRDKLTLTLNVTQDTARSFFLLFFKRHTDWLKLLDRTFYTCIFVQNYIFKYTPPPPFLNAIIEHFTVKSEIIHTCAAHVEEQTSAISENLEFLHRAFSQKSEIIHTCAAHVEEQTSAMTRRNITRTRNTFLVAMELLSYREGNFWWHAHVIVMTSCHNVKRELLISCWNKKVLCQKCVHAIVAL